jgi:hypothetical protein
MLTEGARKVYPGRRVGQGCCIVSIPESELMGGYPVGRDS